MDIKLLTVDLTRSEIGESKVDPAYTRDFIGGSGLGARLLWDSLDPKRDPLDLASPLLWITGPLTGSGGPTNSRSAICARSPQTGLWGESNIGGLVGPELRYAGYDGLLITGRASKPVYLWLRNSQAELRDATHLWGKADTYETQRIIKSETGEPMSRVACIGLAGEHGVPFAAILSDHGRLAGRVGMGALMGSKNLKAIAVRGTGKIAFAQPEDYKRQRVEATKALMEENMTAVWRETGTAGGVDYLQMLGDMPQKYWTQGAFENAANISGGTMAETILTNKTACQGCVISCGRAVTINDGPYATDGEVKGPEYETVAALGSQLLIDDLAAVTALGNLCDAVGIDTISAGGVLGLAHLMFDRGILTPHDTGGLELRWGDPQPSFQLIKQIARREGFGALLAQGAKSLAAHYGVEELAAHVNNLEVPMHDPRALSGSALVYVTSPRGACHNQSDYFVVEMGNAMDELGIPMTARLEDGDKAQHVARHQDYRTVCNSLASCFFAAVPPSTYVNLLSAATGHTWTLDEMMLAGERAWNLKRAINCRLGLTRVSEKLPKLLLEALPDGGTEGHVPNMDLLLTEYYAARDWDLATGRPSRKKLESLGLGFAAATLYS